MYSKISEYGGAREYCRWQTKPGSDLVCHLQEYKESLAALVTAGLCYKVQHSACSGLPIGAEISSTRFNVVPFDIGIYQKLSQFNLAQHIVTEEVDLINKGSAAEVFVGLELASYASPYARPELYYWHREAQSSNAEVDYVAQLNHKLVPIEVKSSAKGSM